MNRRVNVLAYVISDCVSLIVSLISYFMINVIVGLWNVHKFKNMYRSYYINPLVENVKSLDVNGCMILLWLI